MLGLVPALSTSNWSPASCRKSPSAIWLRAEFPVQRISTLIFGIAFSSHALGCHAAPGLRRHSYRVPRTAERRRITQVKVVQPFDSHSLKKRRSVDIDS